MDEQLQRLKDMLPRKQSKAYYAQQLGVTVEEVYEMMDILKQGDIGGGLPSGGNSIKQDLNNDTIEVKGVWDKAPTPEEIAERYGIDGKKYKLSTTWIKEQNSGWLVSASFSPKTEKEDFTQQFKEFLSTYESSYKPIEKIEMGAYFTKNEHNTLILNMQDPHYNKLDIYGSNDIEGRFRQVETKVMNVVMQAAVAGTIDKIVYIVGSDHFNSEWTNATTKGTPQSNLSSYHQGFRDVCDNEVSIIDMLLSYAQEVEVVFCPGNHDQYVSWHMVTWLEAFYKNEDRLIIDSDPRFTKYRRIYNSAFCINHGDAQPPARLANNFSYEFRHEWANCDHFYILTGDKHHNKADTFGAMEWYQVPALSKSVSYWDDKHGWHIAPVKLTAFLVSETEGIKNIYKEIIQ